MSTSSQPPVRTGLLDFLKNSSGCQFVIPVYQRNYTWTAKKEVKQYLEDLTSILKEEYKNHFLGIFIYLDQAIDFSSREFSVIDGQQRLTTTFLILYAIREIMNEQKEEDAIKSLDGQFLTNPFAKNEKIKYKLKPLVSDDSVYQYIISNRFKDIEDKDSLVYKNYVYILDYINKLNKDFSYNDILMAMNKLYIVCIPLSEEDNAQKIFESINSTGVKLTASDLIRNFLLMDLNSELQDKYYSDYWMELEEYLGSDSKKLESFFRFYLSIKNKDLPNKNAVYKEFVNWYKKMEGEFNREDIFKDILKFAKYYNETYYKDIESLDNNIRESIEEFRKINSDMPAPLIMYLFDLYHNGKISAEQFSQMVYIINSYLIRRALCALNTNYITRLFPTLLKDVLSDCNGDYRNIVNTLKKNLVFKNINNNMYVPNDIQLRDIIMNSNMYKIKLALRIFLDKLEHFNNPAQVNLSDLSIEHLMPQTPTSKWLEELEVDEEEYQRNLNRLGNLTLVAKSDNSKMKNKVWAYKNEILSNTSHLTINQDILKKEKWDIDAINERTETLIDEINKLFPYPKTDYDVIETREIFINQNGIKASGLFYLDNGAVEIYEGSELLKSNNPENYPEIEEERQSLIDEGIIFDNGDKLIFTQSYMFNSKTSGYTALSNSASIILQGSRNGWSYWMDASGTPLEKIDQIRKLFK